MKRSCLSHILTLTYESTWSHDPVIRIRLEKDNEGHFIASFTKKGGLEMFQSQYPSNSQKVVSEDVVNDILSSLARVKISPFPQPTMGCDGGFTILELGGYEGSASFRWWNPPKEWKPLDRIANKIWSLFLKR